MNKKHLNKPGHIIVLLLFLICSIGCSTLNPFKKTEIADPAIAKKRQDNQKKMFQKGVLELDSSQYKKAAISFEKYLKKHPSSNLEFMSLYNLGAAYEGLGHCGSAANRYRMVTKNQKGANSKLKARAMLRLSYMYECLNKDTLVVATLADLLRSREHLPKEVAHAEVPARLAAAYSRLGNNIEAKKFFLRAQEGLKIINRTSYDKKKKKALMAKTYYYMGDISNVDFENIEDFRFVDHVNALQVYLLRSVELNVKKWSVLSANQLITAYDKVIEKVEKHNLKMRSIESNSVRSKMMIEAENISVKTLSSIEYLNTQRFPDKNEPQIVEKLFLEIQKRKRKIQVVLASSEIENPLTRNAKNRIQRLTPKTTKDVPGEEETSNKKLPSKKK